MFTLMRNVLILAVTFFLGTSFAQPKALTNYKITTDQIIILRSDNTTIIIPIDGSKTVEFIMACLISGNSCLKNAIIDILNETDFEFGVPLFILPSSNSEHVKEFVFYKKKNGTVYDEVIRIKRQGGTVKEFTLPNGITTIAQRRKFDYIAGQLIEMLHVNTESSEIRLRAYISVGSEDITFTIDY